MSPRAVTTLPALCLALLPAGAAVAQAPSFSVEPEATQVQVGQPFQVVCRIQAASEVEDLELPDVGELTQLGSSRSEGSQVTIAGGQLNVARQITVVLTLQAEQPGRYTLGAGRARAGGQEARSEPVVIEARGAASSGHPAPHVRDDHAAPVPGQPRAGFEKIFLALAVDRPQVVLGQQLTATLTLYSRIDLTDLQSVRLPDFEGVVVEELEAPRRVSGRGVILDGKRYQAYTLRSLALFPTRAGLLPLPAASVVAVVGGGFFSAGQRARLESEPVEVEVLPLPVAGRPAGFEPGNVGDYALEVALSARSLTLRDPLTVKVSVVGRGNLRTIAPPAFGVVDGFRVYQPTPFEELQIGGGVVRGRKGYEVLLQPQRTGTLVVPSLVLAFYDPEQRQYRSARSQELSVEVTGATGEALAATGADPISPTSAPLAARPVRLSPGLAAPASPWPRPVVIAWLVGLSLLSLALLVVDGARRRRLASAALLRQRARLQARRAVLEGAGRLSVEALARAVDRYLELVLEQPVRGLTRDGLGALLAQHDLDGERAEQVQAFGDAIEASRYAPPDLRRPDDLTSRARALVAALEPLARDEEQAA